MHSIGQGLDFGFFCSNAMFINSTNGVGGPITFTETVGVAIKTMNSQTVVLVSMVAPQLHQLQDQPYPAVCAGDNFNYCRRSERHSRRKTNQQVELGASNVGTGQIGD